SYARESPTQLPSAAFGISLHEPAMDGNPMISCEIGTGTSYVNIDEDTGLAVPAENPPALSEALRRLWESPDDDAGFGE
ncbi:glycosyl transferase family 1, partial [Pseudomonas syringae pv. tagetis]